MRHLVTLVMVLAAAPAGVAASDLRDGAEPETPEAARPEHDGTIAVSEMAIVRRNSMFASIAEGSSRASETVQPLRPGGCLRYPRARGCGNGPDGHPLLRVDATVRVTRTEVIVELALEVNDAADDAGEGQVQLTLPVGATATAVTLVGPDGSIERGRSVPVDEARAAFRRTVDVRRDPALLELDRRTEGGDVLRLSVAPLGRTPTTVTVLIRVPRAGAGRLQIDTGAPSKIELAADAGTVDRLEIRGGAPRVRGVDGTLRARARRGHRPIAIRYGVATDPVWFTEPTLSDPAPVDPVVDADTAILALPEPRGRSSDSSGVPLVYLSPPDGVRPTRTQKPPRSGREIRSVVRLHLPRIRHCFQQALQRDWTQVGTLNTQWLIRFDGHVEAVAVGGAKADAALKTCVTGVLESIVFAESDDVLTQVNYPFNFNLGPETQALPCPETQVADLAAN